MTKNKGVKIAYTLLSVLIQVTQVYQIYYIFRESDISIYSNILIFYIGVDKIVDIVKRVFFSFISLDIYIEKNKYDQRVDTVLVYYLSQLNQHQSFLYVYINCFLSYWRAYFLINNRLAYIENKGRILGSALIRLVTEAIVDFVVIEIIVGYFTNPVEFSNLPNIFVFLIIMHYSYGQQFGDNSRLYYMLVKTGIHVGILCLFFPQQDNTLVKFFVTLKIFDHFFIKKSKTLEFQSQTLPAFLEDFTKELKALNENSKTNYLRITMPITTSPEDPNLVDLQVEALSKLAHAQSLLKMIYVKRGEKEIYLTWFQTYYLPENDGLLGELNRQTLIQYLTTSKYLILINNETWTGQLIFSDKEISVISENRTAIQPFGQPITRNGKRYNHNIYFLMLLAYQKHIYEYMTFDPQQIFYDLLIL